MNLRKATEESSPCSSLISSCPGIVYTRGAAGSIQNRQAFRPQKERDKTFSTSSYERQDFQYGMGVRLQDNDHCHSDKTTASRETTERGDMALYPVSTQIRSGGDSVALNAGLLFSPPPSTPSSPTPYPTPSPPPPPAVSVTRQNLFGNTMNTVMVSKPPSPAKQQNEVTWFYTQFQRRAILESVNSKHGA